MRRYELGMDSVTSRWLVAYSARNYWRVAPYIDFEDLLQDGQLVFWRVRRKYLGRRSSAHLINTFKASFINHMHDLASARTHSPIEVQVDVLPQPIEQETQTLLAAIAMAPFHIREAIKVFTSEEGLALLRRPYRLRGDGSRETLNERLCKIAGFDAKRIDLAGSLKQFLLN